MIRKVYEADPMICICFLGSIFASFVSLTSPSGRKYITNVVKLGDSPVGAGIRGVTEKGNTYPFNTRPRVSVTTRWLRRLIRCSWRLATKG